MFWKQRAVVAPCQQMVVGQQDGSACGGTRAASWGPGLEHWPSRLAAESVSETRSAEVEEALGWESGPLVVTVGPESTARLLWVRRGHIP